MTAPLMVPPEPYDRDYIVTRPAPAVPARRLRLVARCLPVLRRTERRTKP